MWTSAGVPSWHGVVGRFFPSRRLTYGLFFLAAVDFQRRVHESHVEGLAPGPLQLLAVRRIADRATVRAARRAPVLRQVLRVRVRQHLRRLQPHHRHRLQGKIIAHSPVNGPFSPGVT